MAQNGAGEITYPFTSSFFCCKPCGAGNCLPPVAALTLSQEREGEAFIPTFTLTRNSAKSIKMEEVEWKRAEEND